MAEGGKWTRRKIVHSNMGDMWDFYRESNSKPVDKHTYVDVCYAFNKGIADSIIRESFEFKLPFKLGKLRIRSTKQKIHIKDGKINTQKMPIDWNESKKMWREEYPGKTMEEIYNIPDKKLVVHVNEHNNGYINRWYWDKTLSNVVNSMAYSFKPVKGGVMNEEIYFGKRGLAAWIKDDERTNEYFE